MTHHIVRHDAPWQILLFELDFLDFRHDASSVASRRTSHVRHDASQCVMADYTKLFCCPIQGLIRGFRHDAQHVASRRTPLVRHNARACVTADCVKLFYHECQRQIQVHASWRIGLASWRTSWVRHNARKCVMTDCTKLFCTNSQGLFGIFPSRRTMRPSWRTLITQCVMTHNSCASRRTIVTSHIQLLDFLITLVRHDASYGASWRTRPHLCFYLVIFTDFYRFRKNDYS